MDEQRLIAFFQDLHRHPELAGEEKRTTRRVLNALAVAGIETLDHDLGSGAIAVIRGARPGRVIGLRADMDALPIQEETDLPYRSCVPGVMHACGHDFHTACMLGAALILGQKREQLQGTVKVIFQPAEEISSGARPMLATGLLDDVAEYYACHTYPGFPAGVLGIKEGPVMAAPDGFTIRIQGKGAHAGNPHLGTDPIPAAAALILAAQSIISRSKDAFEPAVLSFTHVSAGNTWNIIPGEALIEGTVRTLNEALRADIHRRLEAMAGIAAAYGCTAQVSWMMGPPPVINDPALCQAARQVAQGLGLTVDRQENTMGGEDFSEYLQKAPGVFIRVGTGGGYANHHPRFTADPAALWPAAQYFAELALQRAGS